MLLSRLADVVAAGSYMSSPHELVLAGPFPKPQPQCCCTLPQPHAGKAEHGSTHTFIQGGWRPEEESSGHPQLHAELETRLDYIKSCLKKGGGGELTQDVITKKKKVCPVMYLFLKNWPRLALVVYTFNTS